VTGNGLLDEDELCIVLQKLFKKLGKPLTPAIRMGLADDVKTVIERFDTDKDGFISFPEFVRMINCPPWRDLLDPDTRNKLKFLQDRYNDKPSKNPADAFLSNCREYFDKIDIDRSGTIDEHELVKLVEQLNRLLGKETDKGSTAVQAYNAITEFGEDGETLSFDEFVGMLSTKAWLPLVPKEAKDEVKLASAKVRAETFNKKNEAASTIQSSTLSLAKLGESKVILTYLGSFPDREAWTETLDKVENGERYEELNEMLRENQAVLESNAAAASSALEAGESLGEDDLEPLAYPEALFTEKGRLQLKSFASKYFDRATGELQEHKLKEAIRTMTQEQGALACDLEAAEAETITMRFSGGTGTRNPAKQWITAARRLFRDAIRGDTVTYGGLVLGLYETDTYAKEAACAGLPSDTVFHLDVTDPVWHHINKLPFQTAAEYLTRRLSELTELPKKLAEVKKPVERERGDTDQDRARKAKAREERITAFEERMETLRLQGNTCKAHWNLVREIRAKELEQDYQWANKGLDEDQVVDLLKLLYKKMGVRFSSDLRFKAVELARSSVERFDKDGDGRLDLSEFLRMIRHDPWKDMMPNDVKQAWPLLLAQQAQYMTKQKEGRERASTVGVQILEKLQRLFEELDTDGSSTLDENELVLLVTKLRKLENLPVPKGEEARSSNNKLITQARKGIEKHSGDGETLTFDEFVSMLGSKPWIKLLPQASQDELLLKSALSRSESPMRQRITSPRSPTRVLYGAAKRMFDHADLDGDGHLDEEELGVLLTHMYADLGKPLSAEMRMRVVMEVQSSMKNFDSNCDGWIDFDEFIRMINAKPWRDLLKPDVREELRKVHYTHMPDKEQVTASGDFLAKVKAIFDDLDTDHSSTIDDTELMILVKRLAKQHGLGPVKQDDQELSNRSTKAILKYGDPESMTLTFNEFTKLMLDPAWSVIVPTAAKDEILLHAARQRAENLGQERTGVEERSSEKQFYARAKRLFAGADANGNGSLEEEEMVDLLAKLFKESGIKMSADVKIRTVEHVRTALKMYADEQGMMTFSGFIRMLTSKPWCDLLPPDLKISLPFHVKRVANQLNPPTDQPGGPSASDKMMSAARRFFEEGDTDASETMDQFEMVSLIKKVVQDTPNGVQLDGEGIARLQCKTAEALAKYAKDGETLGYNQFLICLGTPYFLRLLPKSVQDDVRVTARRIEVEEQEKALNAAGTDQDLRAAFDTRTLGRRTLCHAKKVFDYHDDGFKGWLDEDDIRRCTIQAWGAVMGGDPGHAQVMLNVQQAMKQFDPNSTRRLDFVHFLRMLGMAPWCGHLDDEMKGALTHVVLQYVKENHANTDTPADRLMEAAADLFEAEDVDGNGTIDRSELTNLVHQIGEFTKQPFTHEEEDALLDNAITNYGVDGEIDFESFLSMLVVKPWSMMVPREARDATLMSARKARLEGSSASTGKASPSCGGKSYTKTSFGLVGSPVKGYAVQEQSPLTKVSVTPGPSQTPEEIRLKLLELQAMMCRLKVMNTTSSMCTISWPHNFHAKTRPTYIVSIAQGDAREAGLTSVAMLAPEEYLDLASEYYPQDDGCIRYTVTNLQQGSYQIQVAAAKGTWRTPLIGFECKPKAAGGGDHDHHPCMSIYSNK